MIALAEKNKSGKRMIYASPGTITCVCDVCVCRQCRIMGDEYCPGAARSPLNNAPESVRTSVCSEGNTRVKNYNIEERVYHGLVVNSCVLPCTYSKSLAC